MRKTILVPNDDAARWRDSGRYRVALMTIVETVELNEMVWINRITLEIVSYVLIGRFSCSDNNIPRPLLF